MKIFAIANQKGGVGKTTSAVNLADHYARNGRRVLVVDLDPQSNVSESFGVESSDGLYRLINKEQPVSKTVVNVRPNLDIIPNDHTAEDVKAFASRSDYRAMLIYLALQTAEGYDVIFLDTPPSSDVLHVSALVASDYLLIPTLPDHLAAKGVVKILHSARAAGRFPGVAAPTLIGILPIKYDRQSNETQKIIRELGTAIGNPNLIMPPIPTDVKVREASSYGKTIWEYASRTSALIGHDEGNAPVRNSAGRVGGYLHIAEIIEPML